MRSIVKNYIFHMIRTFSGMIFPIITFTYSARILGDIGIGKIQFCRAIITYFIMFATLGMNYYGTREAAKLRDDPPALSKFVREMLLINGVTTTAAYGLLGLAMFLVPKLHAYTVILCIYSLMIFLQVMSMEWLFQAEEDYRYIALRTVAFQVLSLAAMFIFVRDRDDVVPYAVVNLMSNAGFYVVNFFCAGKYVRFSTVTDINVKKHLKPLFWLFAMEISIELYTVLDSTMLGFIKGDAAVGRYTAAIKINKLANSLITALCTVLIPRFAYYVGRGEMEQVQKLMRKAYNYVFMLSVPAAVGLFVTSNEVIRIFSGSGFDTAAVTMRLLTPIVLVIPFSVATNIQAFVAMGKERLIMMSTLTGAVSNFCCNFFLIPRYAENGAAIGTVVAESAVAVVCYINANRFFPMRQVFSQFYQYVLATLPIPLIGYLMHLFPLGDIVRTGLIVTASVGTYFLLLWLQGNTYMKQAFETVLKRKEKR